MTVTIVFFAFAVFGATAAPKFYSEQQQQWQYWRQHELAPPQVKQNQNLVQPQSPNVFKETEQFQQWPQRQGQREAGNAYNVPESHFGVQQQPWGQWEVEPPKQIAQQQPKPQKPYHVRPTENESPEVNAEFQQHWGQWEVEPPKKPLQQHLTPQKPHVVIPNQNWQQPLPQKPHNTVANVNNKPEIHSEMQHQPWGQWEVEPPKQIAQQQPKPQKPYHVSPTENKSPEVNAEFQQPWGQWELDPPKKPLQQQLSPQKPHVVIPNQNWQQPLPQKPHNTVTNMNNKPEIHSEMQHQPWGQWEVEPPKQIAQQQPKPQKPYHVSPTENKSPEVNAQVQQWIPQQESEKQKPQQNRPHQITKPQRELAPQRQKPKPQIPLNYDSMENEGPPRFQKDSRCPRIDNIRKPTHLPIAGDCTKFLKCVEGLAYEQNCPAGLEFGVGVNRCDYPKKARCSINQ